MHNKKFQTFLPGLLVTAILSTPWTVDQAIAASGKNAHFQRIATFANYTNNGPQHLKQETVSEIIAATKDGMTLVYTDSPGKQIGFVDIADPGKPAAKGVVAVGGEPTSVDVLANRFALVAVNTSADYINTGGELVVVDIATRAIVRRIDLGGQPDSIKISPDGHYVAIAIENERNEDIKIHEVKGGLPQMPAGYLSIIDLQGNPDSWTRRDVALTGLAAYGSDDPEPEFVDINTKNQAVVTMQENNHVAVVDLKTGKVIQDFSAGNTTLHGVDGTKDKIISLTETLRDVPREPDAVSWVSLGQNQELIGTANEGDLFGGSRGFTLFSPAGDIRFDSGASLEHLAVENGHYPEKRSAKKGTEPEAIEFGHYNQGDYLFVGSERGSFVAVYSMNGSQPLFQQILPAPLAPEGILALPQRNLFIASGEGDTPPYGVRSTIMIYQLQPGRADYPQIHSQNIAGTPLPWSALSGMVADTGNKLLAVWDSFYSKSAVLTIDAGKKPALITQSTPITGGSGNYDPEGVVIAPDNTLWIASEGKMKKRPNLLIQLDREGHVQREVGLPDEIIACRQASSDKKTLNSGFEGVSVLPEDDGSYKLLVAQQRGWNYTTDECEALDDDNGGFNKNGEPNNTRIWVYDPKQESWDHFAWELAPVPEQAKWIGLSEITLAPDGSYVVIERDNRTGDFARSKHLVRFEMNNVGDGILNQEEKSLFDLVPVMKQSGHGWISDKIEGIAITKQNKVFAVTDNDGVDDWSGETQFLDLGPFNTLFSQDTSKK
ncbi:esterase-like activity of phytase family protein [Desulfobulbus rhabdoformis]|uniref:esterase-like activity of phytase family protein n=1 Tax=Desulfobulbus rhabdoformis TaxID=34032 RepID=UPI0019626626|nr:esterase-like activity of phytase family protein [Desulfobulbus rhabdoformis]MBM9615500.1 esterase-like activity of phytase family protein [Desulfobulbus rhabdoformis]